jgi:hypothetical protein
MSRGVESVIVVGLFFGRTFAGCVEVQAVAFGDAGKS